jgi:hypothetical protein
MLLATKYNLQQCSRMVNTYCETTREDIKRIREEQKIKIKSTTERHAA